MTGETHTGASRTPRLLMEAVKRYVDSREGTSNHRNYLTQYQKMFGLSGWPAKGVFSFPTTMMVHELDRFALAKFRDARLAEGLSPASVNIELKTLQRVHHLCRDEWGYSVSYDIKFKMLPTVPKVRYLTKDEEVRVLAHLARAGNTRQGQVAHDLFVVLLDTGLRLNEALTIRAADVDHAGGVFEAYRSKVKHTKHAVARLRGTKRCMAALRRRMGDGDGMVFVRHNRAVKFLRRILDSTVNADKVMVERRGRCTLHSLRDTFATRLVVGRMSLYQVSTLLGHSDMQMTKKYAHLEYERTSAEAAALLEGS